MCGIDLAVVRPTSVGVIDGDLIHIFDVWTDEEIVELCGSGGAIDSPLSHSKGFREVDRKLIRAGYRVLPPSWMKSLVERAIRLSLKIPLVETHPTSSEKNLGLSVKGNKDHLDAAICALTYKFYLEGKTQHFSAADGEVHLIPKGIKLELNEIENNLFEFRV
jgi:Uncharacterized conserved protein